MTQLMEFLLQHHLFGLVTGLCTFLIIGLFHPLVIKGEYYFGVKIWRVFLVAGILLAAGALLVSNLLVASLLGVAAFSSFWAILETFQQQERVHKGWFPRNPRRRYPWDDDIDPEEEPR